jgi:hypothetical protein
MCQFCCQVSADAITNITYPFAFCLGFLHRQRAVVTVLAAGDRTTSRPTKLVLSDASKSKSFSWASSPIFEIWTESKLCRRLLELCFELGQAWARLWWQYATRGCYQARGMARLQCRWWTCAGAGWLGAGRRLGSYITLGSMHRCCSSPMRYTMWC